MWHSLFRLCMHFIFIVWSPHLYPPLWVTRPAWKAFPTWYKAKWICLANPLRDLCRLNIYMPGSIFLVSGTTHTHTCTCENFPQHALMYPPRNVFKWIALICSVEQSSIGGYLNGSQLPLTGLVCLPLQPGLPGCYWHAAFIDASDTCFDFSSV